MAVRFNKRIKLIGGLGINLGKKGASLSLRTKAGSISSRGVSMRTGVPGLTVQSSFKNNKTKSTSNQNVNNVVNQKSQQVTKSKKGLLFYIIAFLGFAFLGSKSYVLAVLCFVVVLYIYAKKTRSKG